MKAADDFTAILKRLKEIENAGPRLKDDPNGGEQTLWMPKCTHCSDTGWRRLPTHNGWERMVCDFCHNPENKP